jgi:hypothetical protein
MSEESVFFNQAGIKITDAVFTTPNGDNFPIRNISSVAVRQSNPWVKLLIGGFLTFFGLVTVTEGRTVWPFVFFVPGILLLVIWWQNYYWALFVGTAGGQQPAIKFKAKDPILKEVEQAINAAILKVQGK